MQVPSGRRSDWQLPTLVCETNGLQYCCEIMCRRPLLGVLVRERVLVTSTLQCLLSDTASLESRLLAIAQTCLDAMCPVLQLQRG